MKPHEANRVFWDASAKWWKEKEDQRGLWMKAHEDVSPAEMAFLKDVARKTCASWAAATTKGSDVIEGRHIVVTVAFAAGPLSGEYYFLSDQSCFQSFNRELNAALDGTD